MNELKIFSHQEFGRLEIITIDGIPHLPSTECASILGYAKPHDAINQHCRYSVKHRVPHPQNPQKTIEKTFIPKSDLYRLIARSKLPLAERFERWIFEEVLPSIEKNGAYMTPKL